MEDVLELDKDILLSFHSVYAKQGRFASNTTYIASERRVVYRTWGIRRRLFGLLPPAKIPPKEHYLNIPEEIHTEEQLRHFVRQHEPYWLRGSR